MDFVEAGQNHEISQLVGCWNRATPTQDVWLVQHGYKISGDADPRDIQKPIYSIAYLSSL